MKIVLKNKKTHKYLTYNDNNSITPEDTDNLMLAATKNIKVTESVKDAYLKYTEYYIASYNKELKIKNQNKP